MPKKKRRCFVSRCNKPTAAVKMPNQCPVFQGNHLSDLTQAVSVAMKKYPLLARSSYPSFGRFLPEHTTAVRILDRLLHPRTVVITDGPSYRMKDA